MSDLEQTQAIFLEEFDDETDNEDEQDKKKIVSHLKVVCQKGFPEKVYPLYEGDNVIGREEQTCNIAVPLKALSRQHACIEVRGDTHLIYDKGSRNKTKRGKLFLSPEVRYELKHNDQLTFGDVTCVYLIGDLEKNHDSGSETETESNFQTAPATDLIVKESPENVKTTNVTKTLVYDSESEEYDSDQSVDLLQPTQAYLNNDESRGRSTTLQLAVDSDDDITGKDVNRTHNITVKDTPAPTRRQGIAAVVLPESGSDTDDGDPATVNISTVAVQETQADETVDKEVLYAATQAYVTKSADDDQEDETNDKDILYAPTQAYVTESGDDTTDDEDEESKRKIFTEQTQLVTVTNLQDDSDQEANEDKIDEECKRKDKSQLEGDKKSQGFVPREEDKLPVVEVEVEESDEDDDEDVSHLFANPTLACEVDDISMESETQAFTEPSNSNDATQPCVDEDQDGATVAVTNDATVAVSDATVAVSDATVAVSDATVAVSDATVAVSDATVAVSDATVAVSDATVAVSDATVAVSDATVAVTEDATMAVADDATMAVADDATVSVADDAPMAVADDGTVAITEDATMALSDDATVAVADDTTVAVADDATVVVTDDATVAVADDVTVTVSDDATVAVIDDATMAIIDDAMVAVSTSKSVKSKNSRNSRNKKRLRSDRTQIVDEVQNLATVDDDDQDMVEIDDSSTQTTADMMQENKNKKGMKNDSVSAKDTTESNRSLPNIETAVEDATAVMEDIATSPKRGRKRKAKVEKDEEEITSVPKRGRRGKVDTGKVDDMVQNSMSDNAPGPSRIGRRGRKSAAETDKEDTKSSVKGKKSDKRVGETVEDTEGASGNDSSINPDFPRGSKSSRGKVSSQAADSARTEVTSVSDTKKKGSRLPVDEIEATQPYCMDDEAEDIIEATQPYCMESEEEIDRNDDQGQPSGIREEDSYTPPIDEDSSTPPISDVLGVPVVEGEATQPYVIQDDEEIVPDSSEDSNKALTSPVIPLPERSPKKSALASPNKKKVPSPKMVTFAKRESELSVEEEVGSTKRKVTTKKDVKASTSRRGRSAMVDDTNTEATAENVTTTTKRQGRRSVQTSFEDHKFKSGEAEKSGTRASTTTRGRRSTQTVVAEQSVRTKEDDKEEVKPTTQRRSRRSVQTTEDGGSVKTEEKGKGEVKRTAQAAGDSSDVKTEEKGRQLTSKRGRRSIQTTEDSSVVKSKGKGLEGGVRSDQAAWDSSSVKTEEEGKLETNVRVSRRSAQSSVIADFENVGSKATIKAKGRESLRTSSSDDKTGEKDKMKTSARGTRSAQLKSEEVKVEAMTDNTGRPKRGSGMGKNKLEPGKQEDVSHENKIKLDPDPCEMDDNAEEDLGKSENKKVNKNKKGKGDVKPSASSDTVISSDGQNLSHEKEPCASSSDTTRTGRGRKRTRGNTETETGANDTAKAGHTETPEVDSDSVKQNNTPGPPGEKVTGKGKKNKKSDKASDKSDEAKSVIAKDSEKDLSGSLTVRQSRKQGNLAEDLQRSNSSVESSSEAASESNSKGTRTKGKAKAASKGQVEIEAPVKKSKQDVPGTPQHSKSSSLTVASPSLRRKSIDPKPKVLFTGVVDEQGQKIVKELGGELVNSVYECTHLVTDKVRRTVKFLCCLSRGLPIISPQWLHSCKASGMFVDSAAFLVSDTGTEKQYKFSLQRSITKASEGSLLDGYKIHVTKSVRPDPQQMKEIIKCTGAEFLNAMPRKAGEGTVVVSCPDDKSICESALKADIPVVNAEFLLTGILRQEVDVDSYRIFNEKTGQKRARDSSVSMEPAKKRRR